MMLIQPMKFVIITAYTIPYIRCGEFTKILEVKKLLIEHSTTCDSRTNLNYMRWGVHIFVTKCFYPEVITGHRAEKLYCTKRKNSSYLVDLPHVFVSITALA